jgi:hypothetical protein
MTKQVVVAFVAGSPVEIAHMVTTVLAQHTDIALVLEALIPLAGQPVAAVFNRSNGDQEPNIEQRLTFVSYAVFRMQPDDAVFDTRARVHVESLGLTGVPEAAGPMAVPSGPRVQ